MSNTTAYMGLHPAVIELGYQFGIGTIRGDNTRCRAMLVCYCTILKDFCNTSKNPRTNLLKLGRSSCKTRTEGRSG